MFDLVRMRQAISSIRTSKPSNLAREATRALILAKAKDEHPDCKTGFGEG